MQHLDILRPDDWHLHLRDGELLPLTVNATARIFRRAIVMPNLKPPVTTTAAALAYRERILAVLDPRLAIADFQPLMTLYLTDATDPGEIARAQASGCVHGVKLYPAGATTNSEAGVTDIRRVHAVLGEMERRGMPLLVHGEVTAPEIDVFDREQVFIDTVLEPLLRDFPGLKVVFEHITTKQAVDFVMAGPAQLAATITPHHLLY
ncbi:MAG: amidohydrolase family protein, partial [Pseudomonadales bacterium]